MSDFSDIGLITLDLDDTLWPCDSVIRKAEEALFQFLRQQAARLTEANREDASEEAIRTSLASLPEYWQRYFRLLYEYYVFRQHGDPYPTLPGMLDEVARSKRPGFIGRLKRQV